MKQITKKVTAYVRVITFTKCGFLMFIEENRKLILLCLLESRAVISIINRYKQFELLEIIDFGSPCANAKSIPNTMKYV